ncbi:hypothetical protein NQ318_015515 [Aromia moschata]|uniref:Uncharacterized protein n=1 Tax=Aromia moschata TaxID=1265417 RepID=A0AAV8XPN6_9CUCU|nr:hypothetical protein NQ318_015515 [Aromia moschata]
MSHVHTAKKLPFADKVNKLIGGFEDLLYHKTRTKETEVVRCQMYLSASRRRCKQCCARRHVICESHVVISGQHVVYTDLYTNR